MANIKKSVETTSPVGSVPDYDTAAPGGFFDRMSKAVRRLSPSKAAHRRASQVEAGNKFSDLPPAAFDALALDPRDIMSALGFVERRTAVTYASLVQFRQRMPYIDIIIDRFKDDISLYCQPNQPFGETGFKIALRDTAREPTRTEIKLIQQMQDWILTSGTVVNGNRTSRAGLMDLLKILTDDSMAYDQFNIELLRDGLGRPAAWTYIDAATVRRAIPKDIVRVNDYSDLSGVQVVQNNVVALFDTDQVVWGTRNPRSAMNRFGYGVAEIETVVDIIGHLINGIDYNGMQFRNGVLTRGILNIGGRLSTPALQQARQQIAALLTGVHNAFRLPILNQEKIDYIPLNRSNRDMEFGEWLNFLLQLLCAAFRMDSLEINAKLGSMATGQKAMFEGPNKAKFTESRQRRMFPVVTLFERIFNEHILWKLLPDFQFVFTGKSVLSAEEQMLLLQQQTRIFMTVDEARATRDMPPLADGIGTIPDSAVMAERAREVALAQMQRQLLDQTGNIDGMPKHERGVMEETAGKVVFPKVMEPHDEPSAIIPGMDEANVDYSKVQAVLGYDGIGNSGEDVVVASKAAQPGAGLKKSATKRLVIIPFAGKKTP